MLLSEDVAGTEDSSVRPVSGLAEGAEGWAFVEDNCPLPAEVEEDTASVSGTDAGCVEDNASCLCLVSGSISDLPVSSSASFGSVVAASSFSCDRSTPPCVSGRSSPTASLFMPSTTSTSFGRESVTGLASAFVALDDLTDGAGLSASVLSRLCVSDITSVAPGPAPELVSWGVTSSTGGVTFPDNAVEGPGLDGGASGVSEWAVRSLWASMLGSIGLSLLMLALECGALPEEGGRRGRDVEDKMLSVYGGCASGP